jgi:hypothetical protein
MELEGERFRAQESVFESVCNSVEWSSELRGHREPFIAPQGNLAVGVLETWACPTTLSETRPGNQTCLVLGS